MREKMKRRTTMMNSMTRMKSIMTTNIMMKMSTMRKRKLQEGQTKNQRKRNTPLVKGEKETEDVMKSSLPRETRREFHSSFL